MKGLIALRHSTDAFHLGYSQDIKERVHLITVPGQMALKKKTWSSATKLLLQTVMSTLVFVNADNKALVNLLRNRLCSLEKG